MTSGDAVGRIKGVDLLTPGVYELIPQFTLGNPTDEVLFFGMFAYAVLIGIQVSG